MRLEHLQLRGFMTAFAGKDVSIDFTALPDGLIAVVGGNGEGKTTILEAAPAGLYREMLSRTGDLKTYAMDRDSCIESRWSVGDARYRARLTVDGIKGGSAAALERVGDPKPLNDGKVSTYDPAVAAVFPPVHVFKASAFATQNKSGSFVKASKKERRDIFASFLNLDRLVRMSEAAKAAAAEVDKVRTRVQADVDVLARETAGAVIEDLQRQQGTHQAAAAACEERRDTLTAAIAHGEQRLAALADQVASHAAATGRVQLLADALVTQQQALDAHTADDLAAARLEDEAVTTLEVAHRTRTTALDARDAETVTVEARELEAIATASLTKLADLDTKLAGNAQIQAMAGDIRAAVATVKEIGPELPALQAQLDQLRADERAIAQRRAENERAIHAYAKPEAELDRAETDAALLGHVPCGGRGEFADCQLLVNAKQAEARIAELKAHLAGVVGLLKAREGLAVESNHVADAITAKAARLDNLQTRLRAAQPTADYADKLAASEARVEELTGQRAAAAQEAAQLRDQARARHAAGAAQRADERLAIDRDVQAAREALTARIHARLAATRAKHDRLTGAVTAAAAAYAAALADLQALTAGSQQATDLQRDLVTLRADRDAAVTAIATAASDAAALARRLEDLAAQGARLNLLRQRLVRLDTELVEWHLLQRALDRDGLPALETDLAGPEISGTTNLILADCFESRFSVELVTEVARADGKGMKDEFTVLVTDNHTGDIRDISDLSGGEEIIVAEALMNAISIFVNERSVTPMRTCFRDETTGALSKENTQRYVQMLRKVQAVGGFRQIVFISHDPDAYALADAQLHVAGGAVTPVLPPYREAA